MTEYIKVGADTTDASQMDEFVRDFERAVNLVVVALDLIDPPNPILDELRAVLSRWDTKASG